MAPVLARFLYGLPNTKNRVIGDSRKDSKMFGVTRDILWPDVTSWWVYAEVGGFRKSISRSYVLIGSLRVCG